MIQSNKHFRLAIILLFTYLLFIGFTHSAQAKVELSEEQLHAIQNKIRQSGGILAPADIEKLKDTSGFQELTPEEIMQGKKLLDSRSPEKIQTDKNITVDDRGDLTRDQQTDSLFSRYRSTAAYQDISTDLKPFGYEFFLMEGKRLLPRKDLPVTSDYIIGPGDEVKIMLWGRINAQYSLVVDRDGNITIPQIGPLQVSGMEFDTMKSYLAEQAQQIVGANINVTMGSLKSIQIFVLGDVVNPGSYALDSFSTISGALLASGGPTDIGSMRLIQLKRDSKTLVTLDFYDFLLKGDKSKDMLLQSGDVVFIPTAGPLVGIAGNIKRPAIYELRGKKNLDRLFEMAGGLIPSAYTQQIQIERIQKNEREIVLDINDKDLSQTKDIELQDGDLVKVFPIVDRDMNAVFLWGNIKRPGKYEYKPGMRVRDLIADSTVLLKETYFDYALIKRLMVPDMKEELVPFNLSKLLFENDQNNNIELKPQDRIFIFSKWLFRDFPSVSVTGQVRKAGEFQLSDNYKIRDALLEAGGLTKDASLELGEIYRTDKQGRVKQIYFHVERAMNEMPEDNLLLVDRDKVVIHSLWENRFSNTVSISGDIARPGEYPLVQDMRIKDLVFASGNVLESAYLEETEITSYNIIDGKSVVMEYKTVNLRKALENDATNNLLLKPHDSVFVKRIPEWSEKRYVTLSGEFRFPGTYLITKGETLSSVINRAGGFSDRAYLRGAVFTRESVRKKQQQSLLEMIERLQRELFTEGSVQASVASTSTEVEAQKVTLDQQEKFIESLKKAKATGRMSIRVTHPRLLKGSEYDIALEHNDRLHIPVKNSVVTVTGAVMSQGSFIYSEKLSYKDYIEMTGGYSRYADTKNVYVLKVDGSAMKLSQGLTRWNNSRERWELTSFSEDFRDIEPGDTIIIPERFDRIAWLRNTQSLTQILYQIAVTAGVAVVLF